MNQATITQQMDKIWFSFEGEVDNKLVVNLHDVTDLVKAKVASKPDELSFEALQETIFDEMITCPIIKTFPVGANGIMEAYNLADNSCLVANQTTAPWLLLAEVSPDNFANEDAFTSFTQNLCISLSIDTSEDSVGAFYWTQAYEDGLSALAIINDLSKD